MSIDIRDQLAMAALATAPRYSDGNNWSARDYAKHAYEIADAMLAARDCKPKENQK